MTTSPVGPDEGGSTPAAAPAATYAGPDRRGLIANLGRTTGLRPALALGAGALLVPLAAVAVLVALRAGTPAWTAGLADAAFVLDAAAAIVLGLFWRLVGDAAAVSLTGMAVLSAATVPVLIGTAASSAPGIAWRALAPVPVAWLAGRAVRSPEVRADLRPLRTLLVALGACAALLLVAGLTPVAGLVRAHPGGAKDAALATAGASTIAGAGLLVLAAHRTRVLLVAGVALALSLAAACTVATLSPGGTWDELVPLLLMAGAIELLVAAGGDLQSAIHAVVRHDVRGRRRWEAAEGQLTAVRLAFEGHRHDVASMLSGIDGTLLVLASERERLPTAEVDRLLAAVREEVRWLQARVSGAERATSSFALADLLVALISVRAAGRQIVRCALQEGIELDGRGDRLAIAVDNLLANAARHAPGAEVRVTTRVAGGPEAPVAEIVVADDGPGLSDPELRRAGERGWRGHTAAERPGSGLGLAQCRDLVDAEGGWLTLGPTHAGQPLGRRGLTVTLHVPMTPNRRQTVPESDAAETARGRGAAGAGASVLSSGAGPAPRASAGREIPNSDDGGRARDA